MLDKTDLQQIRDYVINMLPGLLRSDPEIATIIGRILDEHVPRRDEVSHALARLEQRTNMLQREMEQRFAHVDQRLERVQAEQCEEKDA